MSRLSVLLRPLAWLYGLATALRNRAFDCGLLRSRRFPLPVIGVGNLAVGGTGKTPHAEYLLRLLAPHCATALLSRGYGRRTRGYVRAAAGMTATDIGDEPLQVTRKFPAVTVAVSADRCKGLDRLLSDNRPPDVVVLDDAYQHRYVHAGLYILLTDYSRLYTDDRLLPEGRLRESASGARRARIILVTKCPPSLSPEAQADVRRRLGPAPGQSVFFTAFSYGRPYSLFAGGGRNGADSELAGREVLVVTGIAHPESLYRHVEAAGGHVTALRFADHHAFTAADAARLNAVFASLPPGSRIVTTEKDAARLPACADSLSASVREALLVQPVDVVFLNHEEQDFNHIITHYVATHKRNG